jgi:Clp amino terminal domain, pathogenicity island component
MTTESVVREVHHAWAIYLQASEEARRRGDRRTGTDHLLLALLEDPSVEAVLGVTLQQARQALESLDHEALGALGMGSGTDAPALPMRAVPKKPRLRDVAQKDRLRMTPAAKKVLEEASKPNRRKLQLTAQQVLAQILTLQPPDPAAVLLGIHHFERRRPDRAAYVQATIAGAELLIGAWPSFRSSLRNIVPRRVTPPI